ncbi:tRNA lysidine(34) synthetase TilS [Candidatus Vidania fulgoroideorum]
MNINLKINKNIKKFYKKKKKIAISYSGGIDSNILMYFYKKYLGHKIILIYIEHNLNNNYKKLNLISKLNKLQLIYAKINIKKKHIKKMGMEAAYRYYRYKKLIKIMKKKKIKILLLGHNNDDLIETFFINLIRGSGIYGTFSINNIIKEENKILIRPFLNFNRNFLINEVLKNKKFLLIHDKTNNNLFILRNYIRTITKKLSNIKNYRKSINKFINNIQEFSIILKKIAKKDIIKTSLNIDKINKLNYLRIKNLLIHYLRKKMLIPSSNWLHELVNQIKNKKILISKNKNFILSIKNKIKYKKMKILVHKYGGTSLGSFKRIKKVSKRISKFVKKKYKLIIVVSAMSGCTNNLQNICENGKFSDIILFTGEYISLGILCNILKNKKIKVNYLTSWQIPIITNSDFSFAKIKKINTLKFYNYFIKYDVIVVPGFQGINNNGEVTTIGRGGSDNTAINIAKNMKCNCYIYTDVKGIYNKDPNIFKNCKIIKKVLDKEILEVSSLGAKVFQLDSVVNCVKNRVKTKILSSFNKFINIKNEKKNGTDIVFSNMKNFSIVLTCENMLTFKTKKNVTTKIIKKFNNNNILIDNLCFLKIKKYYYLSFSINKKLKFNIKYNFVLKKNMMKISLVGIGIKNYSNNFLNIINKLDKKKINYYCFTTSEIKISFLFNKKYKKKIINMFNK